MLRSSSQLKRMRPSDRADLVVNQQEGGIVRVQRFDGLRAHAFSPALGKTVAMAYVRVAFAEPGTELSIDGAKVIVRG